MKQRSDEATKGNTPGNHGSQPLTHCSIFSSYDWAKRLTAFSSSVLPHDHARQHGYCALLSGVNTSRSARVLVARSFTRSSMRNGITHTGPS